MHNQHRLGFDSSEVGQFSATREAENLDKYLADEQNHDPFTVEDGWHRASVKIRVPAEKHSYDTEYKAPTIEIPGLYHRRLIDIIKNVYQGDISKTFNMVPFEQLWHPDDDDPERIERIQSELYASNVMLEAHEAIQNLPRAAGDTMERLCIPLMHASDATHLASFGTASAWPIYTFFGSQSKYIRSKPTSNACHHLAYVPELSDDFQDQYTKIYGHAASDDMRTHCKRELMHAVWDLLLDEEFMKAYQDGIVLRCTDGILRRFYPRLFTYSADYPEKVLLCCIRNLGGNPCPRCFVRKEDIHLFGTPDDMARRKVVRTDDRDRQRRVRKARNFIYKKGHPIKSIDVERLLKDNSLVPTRCAFSKLSKLGLNFFKMFAVDLLHEYELGVGKSFFTHLIRLVYALGGDKIVELNRRFRAMPTFGRDTIRRFSKNASEMKQIAARDIVNLLLCAIPVFEGLFPEPHNTIVLDAIFVEINWYTNARLGMHTDSSLRDFDVVTTQHGQVLRRFANITCKAYITKELPKESAARGRRTAALALKKTAGTTGQQATDSVDPKRKKQRGGRAGGKQGSNPPAVRDMPKQKFFNLSTYKAHVLPDYPDFIREHGTSDNVNTQTSELQHKQVKRRFARTNKNDYIRQLTVQERRERYMIGLHDRLEATRPKSPPRPPMQRAPAAIPVNRKKPLRYARARRMHAYDPLPVTDPRLHYHIAASEKNHFDITSFLVDNQDDPATKDFYSRLKDHLLARLLNRAYDGDEHRFTDEERETVQIIGNKMYEHSVVRVNYTTYDVRRGQDTINPRTHPDVMVLSQEDLDDRDFHPYWYARIARIFHVNVRHVGPASVSEEPQRMDVLWVRWLGRDVSAPSGYAAMRLHRVGFLDVDTEPDAFGFLDPDKILRASHLMPAFHYGRTDEYMGPSITRREEEQDEDYTFFYVNMFVDRDMHMRYRGGGVGHKATRYCNAVLRRDEHMLFEDEGDVDLEHGDSVNEEEEVEEEVEDGEDKQEQKEDDDEEEEDVLPPRREGEGLQDHEILAMEGYLPL
ncbi:hypothetical protein BV25DRAFT_1893990 [Artomyces pyxidatus]|uniref:Uncharacterized protein n=1 Tax=Artomyces pyxidatus TaxID=48021 RepID=A0ACB8SJF4_9AGAM|nr:hypothetical protein BV25DRAFT_1893990 [Artomyces pyxidatus]